MKERIVIFCGLLLLAPLSSRGSTHGTEFQEQTLVGLTELFVTVLTIPPATEMPDSDALAAEVRTKLRAAGIPVFEDTSASGTTERKRERLYSTGFLKIKVECNCYDQCHSFWVTFSVDQAMILRRQSPEMVIFAPTYEQQLSGGSIKEWGHMKAAAREAVLEATAKFIDRFQSVNGREIPTPSPPPRR